MGAPILISYPYFKNGNQSLRDQFMDFHVPPNRNLESYLNLHPKYGFTMGARNSFQLNILAKKCAGISQMNMFHRDTILPIAWIEMVRLIQGEFFNSTPRITII